MMLSLLNILEDTTVDGPGFRTAIYAAGCGHHCPGCHNPESWDIQSGRPTAVADILRRILADDFADVTFTGGDPMYQSEAFTELALGIRAHSRKTIWCYTGYLFETLLRMPDCRRLLEQIDVLVDGPFIQSFRSEEHPFRGSSNQRLIDVPASLREGRTVLVEYQPLPE